jgi:hypothetical protein
MAIPLTTPWFRRAPCALLFLLLSLGSCRETLIAVETIVAQGGSATRTMTVTSHDLSESDQPLTSHPEDLRLPVAGWSLEKQEVGEFRASSYIADLNQSGSPLSFQSRGQSTRWNTTYKEQDWVLFRRILYQESVRDVIDPTTVKGAIDEASQVAAEVMSDVFHNLIGAGFEDSVLFTRLKKDLPAFFRDAGFIVWQEMSRTAHQSRKDEQKRLERRILLLAIDYGLPLSPKWVTSLKTNPGDDTDHKIEQSILLWVEELLQPTEIQEGRQAIYPDLKAMLFDGPFEQAVSDAAKDKFGGEEGLDDWVKDIESRLFGAFGPSRDDVRFRLTVKLPGTLLRSNGWLQEDGRTFHEFLAGEVFPDGSGLEAESIVWDFNALSALGAGSLIPNNQTALAWMTLLGDKESPLSTRLRGRLDEVLKVCIQDRSLDELEEKLPQDFEAIESFLAAEKL